VSYDAAYLEWSKAQWDAYDAEEATWESMEDSDDPADWETGP